MNIAIEILSWVPLTLLAFNWTWWTATRNMRRCVPGSLEESAAKSKCRLLRWPGFACWPAYVVYDVVHIPLADSLWGSTMWTAFTLLSLNWARLDYRELRRQIEEDDDDPWNKGKRLAKKLRTAVKQAATIRIPVATPVGGMA